ncbi:MAG: hypothetical protein AAB225_12465 [Acidobacteriota bacterium]
MGDRLDSWKEIAAYLRREIRTVQRWASGRRLPVHRLPGGDKPRVYALKTELDRWLRSGAAESAEVPSIAVLPFVNLAGDKENEYFSDGLADEVINALTRIPGLRVTARTSSFAFRGQQQDVREIGARLGAAALLEGSVRKQANRVRVSAQLVSAEDGYHLWSECYDGELADIFAIQNEMARAIASALKIRLAPQPLVERWTEDVEAYNLWLRGRSIGQQYTREAVARAREFYAAALARDPAFPLPHADIAALLFSAAHFGIVASREAAGQAKEAVEKALALNDSLGEAHALLGALRGVLEYDWAGAERAFQRAFELTPGSAMVLFRHAWYYLVPKLRIREALDEVQRAAAQDPLSPLLHSYAGLTFICAREYKGAEEACRIAVELAPGLWLPHWFLGAALLLEGKLVQGFAHCREAYKQLGREPLMIAGMCAVYGLFDRRKKARQMLAELSEIARTAYVPPLAFAWAYLGLRDERVFEWLDKAIDARDPAVTHMPSMPIYDGIRGDPRFQKLLDRMGLG